MKLLIKNGKIINPANKFEQKADLLVEDGIVKKIDAKIKESKVDKVIDAKGCWVMPGFVDLDTHLNDPGPEENGTVISEMWAGARGGYTTIVAMPDTTPVIDNADAVKYVLNKSKAEEAINVLQAGSITKGSKGEVLTDIKSLYEAGVPALSDAGKSIKDTLVLFKGLRMAGELDLPVFAHCEDPYLINGGVMNDDENAKRLDMPVYSNAVEDVVLARDLIVAYKAGVRIHISRCSTHGSIRMIELAKQIGVKVTAEVTPHHFTLTSNDIKEFIQVPENGIMIPHDNDADTNYKVKPPLRTQKDVNVIREGLKNDIIDVIATDHTPHTFGDKNTSMRNAPFGISSIETAAAITYTELVCNEIITPMQMVEKMSYNPAKIIGIDKGDISEGKVADIVIFDVNAKYKIDKNNFVSKGKNTPFDGREVKGKVKATICEGRVVYEA
ncbi:dihydroorotase [Lachnobacterium bovis]|uniref:dihydroorotase n=1 Tax=Lachnobacterium bovis TaxID=140626 RepID=UPI00048B5E76|nr:dihydroorotase [Lachnobacterium bovis]